LLSLSLSYFTYITYIDGMEGLLSRRAATADGHGFSMFSDEPLPNGLTRDGRQSRSLRQSISYKYRVDKCERQRPAKRIMITKYRSRRESNIRHARQTSTIATVSFVFFITLLRRFCTRSRVFASTFANATSTYVFGYFACLWHTP